MNKSIVEDVEAEKALLGSILLGRSEAFVLAKSMVGSADFTHGYHRQAFSAFERLYERGDAIDPTSVAGELKGVTPDEHPMGYLIGLMQSLPTHLNLETYARRVRYCATARRISSTANELAHIAYTAEQFDTENQLIAETQKVMDSLLDGQVGSSIIQTPQVLALDYNEVLTGRQSGDPKYIGIPTGYADLDRFVAYRPGELWYVAASPGVGKTTLLSNLQEELARKKIPSLFASAEQPAVQLMDRAIAADASIDSWKLANGDLNENEWARISSTLARRYELPIYIYDDPSMSTARLAAATQLAKARYGIKVVFVDYVQLLADSADESEYARISAISRRLAHLARTLGICVVAACQVSRKGAVEDGQVPRLSELRGSGSLEQDAFVVLAVGRKESATTAQVAIRKNRNGQAGVVVELYFDPEHTRFRSLLRVA